MTSGEKFAYALALLSVLKKMAPNIRRLWYDVGDRRFESALLNFPELAGIQPMLPRLHAHMHARRCHLLYNGLTFASAGLPNSELSEQENRWLGLVRRSKPAKFRHPFPPLPAEHPAWCCARLVRSQLGPATMVMAAGRRLDTIAGAELRLHMRKVRAREDGRAGGRAGGAHEDGGARRRAGGRQRAGWGVQRRVGAGGRACTRRVGVGT